MKKELLDAGFYFDALEISPWDTNRNIADKILGLKGKYKNDPEIQELLLKANNYLTVERDKYEGEILPCFDYIRLLLKKKYGDEAEDFAIKSKLLSIEKIEQMIKYPSLPKINLEELKAQLPEGVLEDLKGGLRPNFQEISEKRLLEIVEYLRTFKELKNFEPEIENFKRELLDFLSECYKEDAFCDLEKQINNTPFLVIISSLLTLLQNINENLEQQKNQIRVTIEVDFSKLINDIEKQTNTYFFDRNKAEEILRRLLSPSDLMHCLRLEEIQLKSILIERKKQLLINKNAIIENQIRPVLNDLDRKQKKIKNLLNKGKTVKKKIDELNIQAETFEFIKLTDGITFTERKASIEYISHYDWELKANIYIGKAKSLISSPLNKSDSVISVRILVSELERLKKKLNEEINDMKMQLKIQLLYNYKKITNDYDYIQDIRSKNKDIIEKIDKLTHEISQLKIDPQPAIYSSLGVPETEMSNNVIPFGFGYLIDDVLGNILIPIGTSAGTQKQEPTPLGWSLLSGETIHVSLIKSMITQDGERYYKLGDYEFTPVVDRGRISIIPILDMDDHLFVTLAIKDLNSSNPPLKLKLSICQEKEIRKPFSPEEWKKLFAGLNPSQIKYIIGQTDDELSSIYNKNKAEIDDIDDLLNELSELRVLEGELRKNIKNFSFLFSWEEIPGNDSKRLIEFLKHNYGLDWDKTAKIDKIDNGKTIFITDGKKFISLDLNNEKTELILKIDNVIDNFIVKTENGKRKIYRKITDEDLSNIYSKNIANIEEIDNLLQELSHFKDENFLSILLGIISGRKNKISYPLQIRG